jgi:hypothetical protein
MITFDLFQFIAVAFAVCGLAAILVEIAVKNPNSFWEMVSDVRRFAERALPRATTRDGGSAPASEGSRSDNPRISA